MGFTVALPNFSKGELAPALYGRIDTNQYNAALKRSRNFIVQRYGGVTFRPGTRLVGRVDDPTKAVRLAPFQFSIDQAYALLMQQGTMRPMALGGFVLEQNTKITGATKAYPCVLTVPYHGYSVGDRIYLNGIAGMVELNNRFATVISVPDADHVGIDINSSLFGTFVSSDGTLNAAPPPPPPPPPPVPPPYVPPVPPYVGGGGGNYCVLASTLIKTPTGDVVASFLQVGDMVRTRHEKTMRWGNYPIDGIELADEPVMAVVVEGKRLVATPKHRLFVEGAWRTVEELGGVNAGVAQVAKLSVREARTYVSNGLLSHNIKIREAIP